MLPGSRVDAPLGCFACPAHQSPPCMLCPAGVKFLLEEDAVVVGGTNHSHATQVRYGTVLLCKKDKKKRGFPFWLVYLSSLPVPPSLGME